LRVTAVAKEEAVLAPNIENVQNHIYGILYSYIGNKTQ
jgi:hypothetical protein